jgi:mannose-6-phosphate isomerase-like protein (cupin superfamily)
MVVLQGGCLVIGLKEGQPVRDGALTVWRQIGSGIGARAISLRVLQLDAGDSATLSNRGSDEVLYVLEGEARASIDGVTGPAGPDSGIYIACGRSLTLENRGSGPMTVVSCRCPEPGSTSWPLPPNPALSGGIDESTTTASPIVSMRERPVQKTGDRWYREVINGEVGSAQVTQFVGSIPPGRSPDHYHLYEEVICILEGIGVVWAEETSAPIAAGSCIFLPRGQVHCLENTGQGELRLLGVFYPAGSPAVRYAVTHPDSTTRS